MDWSRTLRIDAVTDEAHHRAVEVALSRAGATVRFGSPHERIARTYALVQAPDSVEPDDLKELVQGASWRDEAIIVLAIEPTPADALPVLAQALGGDGAPAGVASCDAVNGLLVVEILPSRTSPALVLHVLDVELARFHGYRRVASLAPLPMEVTARIAADGLQAEEIGPDRILEVLLERSHVE